MKYIYIGFGIVIGIALALAILRVACLALVAIGTWAERKLEAKRRALLTPEERAREDLARNLKRMADACRRRQ